MSSWALADSTGTLINPAAGVLVSTGVQPDHIQKFTVMFGASVPFTIALERLDQAGNPYPNDSPQFNVPANLVIILPMTVHFALNDSFQLRLVTGITGMLFAAFRFDD